MMESQYFLTYIFNNACFLMSCLSESFLSKIPEKASESFLSEVFLPKVFRLKVFDFNVYPPSVGVCSVLVIETTFRMHHKRASFFGFRQTFEALIVLNYWLKESPLSAIANHFEFRCPQKQLMLLS